MNNGSTSGRALLFFGICATVAGTACAQELNSPSVTLEPVHEPKGIWLGDIGDGFAKGASSFEVKLSRGFGVAGGGPKQAHDLWYLQGEYARVLNNAWARNHWYGGNLELTGQLIGGLQDHPETDYFFGLNFGLRYVFATGGRINPFIAASAGVAATGIGLPDLSTVFEFNEQLGAGVRFYLNDHQAITLEYFGQHISNAEIKDPNRGVNAHFISLGFSWLL